MSINRIIANHSLRSANVGRADAVPPRDQDRRVPASAPPATIAGRTASESTGLASAGTLRTYGALERGRLRRPRLPRLAQVVGHHDVGRSHFGAVALGEHLDREFRGRLVVRDGQLRLLADVPGDLDTDVRGDDGTVGVGVRV